MVHVLFLPMERRLGNQEQTRNRLGTDRDPVADYISRTVYSTYVWCVITPRTVRHVHKSRLVRR